MACQREFPFIAGIPDFRLFDPPYVSRREETARVNALLDRYREFDWEGLTRFYVRRILTDLAPDQKDAHLEHRLTLRYRAREREKLLQAQLQDLGYSLPAGCRILDLGCGSGEATVAFLSRTPHVTGVDISLEELVLARKLCEEEGYYSGSFVAACAESLPLPTQSFDFVYSMDVVEHVRDQRAFLLEARKVLKDGGGFLFNSPNRYSLVAAEPHVNLWGVGFLPRNLADPYCRLRGKGPYSGKRLLSYRELTAIVKEVFGSSHLFERRPNPKSQSLAGKLYHALAPFSVKAYTLIAAEHLVFTQVPGENSKKAAGRQQPAAGRMKDSKAHSAES
ncbi:MAG: class I SAM-dependent methyltransferase [Deltaproteobacteria bacterium]|nr:class I SAM-dependent methyltransferase [Deltaproteobacteria bacterium]